MQDKSTPLFRKSMKGYKKEDVNNYIISLNNTIEESRAHYEKALADCNTRAEADYQQICTLTASLKEAEKKNAILTENTKKLEAAEAECAAKDEELSSLRLLIAQLEEKLAAYEAESEGKTEKAQQYDSICAKAGEILVIASSTAEDILGRANNEALRIVGDANTKKDLMLKTFSESVDAAADDINSYIKTAVDDCVKKINASVKEVSEMAAPKAQPEKEQKPKTIFIGKK